MTKAAAIRNENVIQGAIAKARKAGKTAFNLTDGEGLYLECDLTPGKAKPLQWRFQFKSPTTGKRNRLSFGEYIMGSADLGVTIAQARERAAEARALIRQGVDPAKHRDAAREATKAEAQANAEREAAIARARKTGAPIPGSFRAEAADWVEFKRPNWSAHYARTVELSLENHLYPLIGDKPVSEVKPRDLLPLREKHERAGTIEALAHAMGWASAIFARAAEYGRCEVNPVVIPKNLIAEKRAARVHRPAVTSPDSIRALMQAIYAQPIDNTLTHAMLLAALTMQRIGSIVSMRWADVDLDAQVWVIPAANMKLKTTLKRSKAADLGHFDHVVPLSTQAVSLLRLIKTQQAAGTLSPSLKRNGPSQWVLPSFFDSSKPCSRTSASDKLRDVLGYADLHTMHGFRAMGRTGGELHAKVNGSLLEVQLAHSLRGADSGLGQAYLRNREFFKTPEQVAKRSEAVQGWADYLDQLCGVAPWHTPALRLAA